MDIHALAPQVVTRRASVPEDGRYEEFVKAYAQRALVAAADAWAHAMAVKFPPPSRAVNQKAFRRDLEDRFQAAVTEVNRAWTKSAAD